MRRLTDEEIEYWREELNKPIKETTHSKISRISKNVAFEILSIVLTVGTMGFRILGKIFTIGFPVGIYGIWQEYKFISSGLGGFFDTNAYCLIMLFIVSPIVLLTVSELLSLASTELKKHI